MKLIHYNDTINYDIDLTHDQFLCKSGDYVFLSHLGYNEEDGYFVTDEHGVKYFMYNPTGQCSCEVYLIITDKRIIIDKREVVQTDTTAFRRGEGHGDAMDMIDDQNDSRDGGPPYDAATRTGMYDHD